jgi:hypothetical protein
MSTITITNQDYVETTEFSYGECGFSRVYLNGLKEGESVISDNPFLIQNVNGIIAGIDQRFSTLKHVRNQEVIETVHLNWTNSCSETANTALSISAFRQRNLVDYLGIPTLLVILSLGFALLINRIRK